MSDIDPFLAALAFGAVIFFFFARDQFNRPTYERSRELAPLIQLLTPLNMRNRMALWRAYFFYAAILTLIYLILSAYGSLLSGLWRNLRCCARGGGRFLARRRSRGGLGWSAPPRGPSRFLATRRPLVHWNECLGWGAGGIPASCTA